MNNFKQNDGPVLNIETGLTDGLEALEMEYIVATPENSVSYEEISDSKDGYFEFKDIPNPNRSDFQEGEYGDTLYLDACEKWNDYQAEYASFQSLHCQDLEESLSGALTTVGKTRSEIGLVGRDNNISLDAPWFTATILWPLYQKLKDKNFSPYWLPGGEWGSTLIAVPGVSWEDFQQNGTPLLKKKPLTYKRYKWLKYLDIRYYAWHTGEKIDYKLMKKMLMDSPNIKEGDGTWRATYKYDSSLEKKVDQATT
jgi:hypothetical protein